MDESRINKAFDNYTVLYKDAYILEDKRDTLMVEIKNYKPEMDIYLEKKQELKQVVQDANMALRNLQLAANEITRLKLLIMNEHN